MILRSRVQLLLAALQLLDLDGSIHVQGFQQHLPLTTFSYRTKDLRSVSSVYAEAQPTPRGDNLPKAVAPKNIELQGIGNAHNNLINNHESDKDHIESINVEAGSHEKNSLQSSIVSESNNKQINKRKVAGATSAMLAASSALILLSGKGAWRYYLAGGICAAISHAVTTPIDVIKVRTECYVENRIQLCHCDFSFLTFPKT